MRVNAMPLLPCMDAALTTTAPLAPSPPREYAEILQTNVPERMGTDSRNCIPVVDDLPENRRPYSHILGETGCEAARRIRVEPAKDAGATFRFPPGVA